MPCLPQALALFLAILPNLATCHTRNINSRQWVHSSGSNSALPLVPHRFLHASVLDLRGGTTTTADTTATTKTAASGKAKTKTKKRTNTSKRSRKSRTSTTASSHKQQKEAIQEAMSKESAQALGDAIRDRADILRTENPLLDSIDHSIYSVGWALGASDGFQEVMPAKSTKTTSEDDTTVGAVEEEGSPTTPVLVNYFMNSHGGAHAFQCVCSVLASLAGMASLVVPASSPMQVTLLQRTMLFAMIKHVSGLFAAAVLAARAIPEIGLRKARVWMEQLAKDPVSQYVFYTASMLLWLPSSKTSSKAKGAMTVIATSPAKIFLWQDRVPFTAAILLGPILLREVVSTALVLSDVLVLWATSNSNSGAALQNVLPVVQSAVNVVMSLLVTPSTWRSATPAQRQAILAKLTSKVSLALEIAVGVLMTCDALGRSLQFTFGSVSERPSFMDLVKRLILARLYINFLLSRKRKISKLATSIRGGAAQLPFYVLDVLMDPVGSMGIARNKPQQQRENKSLKDFAWQDFALLALGLDE